MATRSKNTGEGSGSCLICGDSKNIGNCKVPKSLPVLSESIQVYFILHHLLELPPEQLQSYLRSCPYPEKWVKICSDCGANYVDKCKRIFKELVEVKRRFQMARMEVLERIKKSEVVPEKERGRGREKRGKAAENQFVLDIWKETRTFVQQRDYETPNDDPYIFQAGDLMAREKAVEMMSKGERTAKTESKCLPVAVAIIPSRQNEEDIKTEPSSPSGQLDKGPNSEESCSEYDPHEAEVSPSSSPNHYSNDFEEIQPVLDKPSNKRKARFPCPKCNKVLSTAHTLKNHVAAFHLKNRKKLKCPHCEKEFVDSRARSLNYHLATVHKLPGYLIHPCSFAGCNKSFAHKYLLDSHSLSHKAPQFACPICGKGFAIRYLLKRHVAQCKLQGEKPFQCDQCPAAFGRKDNLAAHKKSYHSGEGAADGSRRKVPRLVWTHYKCSECGVVSGHRHTVQEHVDKMHAAGNGTIVKVQIGENPNKISAKSRKVRRQKRILECPKCEWKTVSEELLKRHQRKSHTDPDATFTCSYEGCHRTFSDIRRLACHTRAHKQPKDFKCDLCPRQFLREGGLENHKKLRHSALESFKCPFCEMTLSSKNALDAHLYYKHREESRSKDDRIFTCDLCPLTFVRETCLQIHKRLKHKQETAVQEGKGAPLQCSECGQMLSSKAALRNHINKVHEKKFEIICDVCGITLKSRYYMKSHLKTVHKIGDCEVLKHPCTVEGCGRKFQAPSELQRHVAYVHEGSCKFQCETCGKRVISAKNLRRHIEAMHTNREGKPWKCDECGKSFAINEYLWLHKKTHLPKQAKSKVKVERQRQQ